MFEIILIFAFFMKILEKWNELQTLFDDITEITHIMFNLDFLNSMFNFVIIGILILIIVCLILCYTAIEKKLNMLQFEICRNREKFERITEGKNENL